MGDETKTAGGAGAAPKIDPSKVPAGIPVQTGQAAPAPARGLRDQRAEVEKAGMVLVKKNPHVAALDEFTTGDFTIGKTPVAVPADQVAAICAHKDEYGRQLVVKA